MNTSSFNYQWKHWKKLQFESENKGKLLEGYTLRMWEQITGKKGSLEGMTIGDFGCGPGRFLEVVRMKNGRVVGIEADEAALEIAKQHFKNDPHVVLYQGDVLQAPIESNSLDGAFSIGVLHHTKDPFRGFQEMVRTVKPGGWVAVSVYKKGGYYDFPTLRLYRTMFRLLRPLFGYTLPLWYSYAVVSLFLPVARIPFLGKAVRAIFPFVALPDFQWSAHDTFDSLTPFHQRAYTTAEVQAWFEKCGLVDIEQTPWAATSFRAKKPL
ncbi:MAG: class I SAM-dependent methyltransferase [Parcubacteria group bacterium]|nr:class I SAM-dependent methyltransferase [Parcubacteria group bacterium]